MKRIYICTGILALIFFSSFLSNRMMYDFTQQMQQLISETERLLLEENSAINQTDLQESLLQGVSLCKKTRQTMMLFVRIENFTELECSLYAAQGFLKIDAPEEALGELRRASIQAEALDRLCRRWI